jgi:hypothetical protein
MFTSSTNFNIERGLLSCFVQSGVIFCLVSLSFGYFTLLPNFALYTEIRVFLFICVKCTIFFLMHAKSEHNLNITRPLVFSILFSISIDHGTT